MNINFEEILKELEYRVTTGIVDLTKEEHVTKLTEILIENKISNANELAQKARVYFSYLNEAPSKKDIQSVLDTSFLNPDTKKQVKVSSALGYDKTSKAYGIAKKLFNKAGYDDKDIEMVDAGPEDEEKPEPTKLGKADFKSSAEISKDSSTSALQLKPNEVDKKVGTLKAVIAKDFTPELKKKLGQSGINTLVSGFKKMISDKVPSTDEVKTLKNHFALKSKEGEATLYIANVTPGDFKKHKKVEFGSSKSEALKSIADKIGLQSTKAQEGALGRKEMVANKISKQRKNIKPEVQKDGSVKVEGVVHKQMPVPSEKDLSAELKKNGIKNYEEEARLTVNSIKRYNKQVETLKNQTDFEVVDFGDTSTPVGRKNTFDNVKKSMNSRFEELLKREGPLSKEHKEILNELNNIKFNDNGSNPNFEKDLDNWFSKMTLNKDFRTSAPDLLELIVFSKMMGRGYHAFLPSSETFKVSDVVAFKEPDFKISKEKSPAKQVADNFKMIKTSLVMVGGSSVKFAEGGAGQSDSKVEQTEYKNKETKKRLTSLLSTHQFVYGKSKDGTYPPSSDSVAAKEKEILDHLNWATEAGIINKEEYKSIIDEGNKQSELAFNTAKRNGVGPFKTKAEEENYKKLLRLHTLSGSAIEKINNNDTDFNYFSNERTRVNERTGEIRNEELDGVTRKCCMGWSYNPGFKFSEFGGRKWMTPNNVNPSHIVPCDKK